MDSASVALQTLLGCLREHGALLTRADVEWAFNSEKNVKQIEGFIPRFLGKDTLLSLEEKEIYDGLKSTDLLSSTVPPLSSRAADGGEVEKELRALEFQNEVLRRDISRLSELKSGHQAKLKTEAAYQTDLLQSREHLQRSYASERDQNAAAIDDLESNFRASISDLQGASGKLDFTMSAMSEITRNDDRLLARLQSIISDILLASERSGDEVMSTATEYAEMLATLEEQIIKTRVDRTFLDYVASYSEGKQNEMEGAPYIDREEFDELIVEVAEVAGMRAKEGLLEPILEHLVAEGKGRKGSMAVRCAYILNTLSILDARNREAEAEISVRNNMQYVSGRMQTLFELSMRDFHEAVQAYHRNISSQAKTLPLPQPQQPSAMDEKLAYLESKIWRSMGIASLNPEEGLAKAIEGRTTKLQSKEDLYKQLWEAHLKYLQEGEGVVSGLGNCVGEGEGAGGGRLGAVEDRVKGISAEVGQIAMKANGRDMAKAAVINGLKEKEMYGA
ncbi:hypothetical protein TWF970_003409 [Orbilia oligospora]|uniref:Uncharacterized protein n=1 Tax=Orbilia oligospora TaxID=2813651 RepID=A0A7C8RLP9_ORBOL|nr:hypothetical protein TWF970_003409 [Orbilia oligospora]